MAVNEGNDNFLGAFERRHGRGNGASPPWLTSLRRSAIDRFGKLGLPTTRHEDWKYTNIAPVGALKYRDAGANEVDIATKELLARSFADGARHRLVFIDGVYSAVHSSLADLPGGVRFQRLAELLGQDEAVAAPWLQRSTGFYDTPFVLLNTAFAADGAAIFIAEGCRLEEPIYVIYVSSGRGEPVASHPRNLIVVGGGGEAKIVESYIGLGSGAYFNNPVTEIAAAAGSVIDHYRLQSESAGAYHVGALRAHLQRDTRLASHNITLAGGLVRNDIYALLDGEGAECQLNGLYLSDAGRHIDNHTEIDHAQPRAVSYELYKGILGGSSRGVFNGKILVREAAQKSDARQSNKNLLLSKDAMVHSKPQLEIHADDVKCSHGSSIGQLDRDALFYLRSRGIGENDARSVLSYAFAAEILNRMKVASLRARLDEHLLSKFGRTAARQ